MTYFAAIAAYHAAESLLPRRRLMPSRLLARAVSRYRFERDAKPPRHMILLFMRC